MTSDKIEEFDKLLQGYIGENKTIVDTKLSRLTAPGENYGSILLKVDVTLKDKNTDSLEYLHAVAKLIPEDEDLRKIFNIQVSCKVEIGFYDTVVPTLQQFQKEKGVQQVMDFFPQMYAGRINLNGSDIADENAVLLLENLAEKGYKNVDRFDSFDLPTIELVLKDLATFHAVPLALKLLEPETFNSKIQPFLVDHEPSPPTLENGERKFRDPFDMALNILETDDECKPLIPQMREVLKLRPKPPRNEPFVSICHGDFWINNTMLKFEDGKPVSNKMVDFQNPRYLSPIVDLFFLLWTSVSMDILEERFDDLVRFYHEHFVERLEQLGCDASPFTLEMFLEELKLVAGVGIMHVVFFTVFVVFSKKDESKPIKHPHDMQPEDISDAAKERLIYFIRSCKRKGWLDCKNDQ